jgi:hypothetical protein
MAGMVQVYGVWDFAGRAAGKTASLWRRGDLLRAEGFKKGACGCSPLNHIACSFIRASNSFRVKL